MSTLHNILNTDTQLPSPGTIAFGVRSMPMPMPLVAEANGSNLKRTASPSFEEGSSRKRMKENVSEDGDYIEGGDEERNIDEPQAPYEHVEDRERELSITSQEKPRDRDELVPGSYSDEAGTNITEKEIDERESRGHSIDGQALVEHLAEELQCGCCSELVYRPVIVAPCQHFFCGRYICIHIMIIFSGLVSTLASADYCVALAGLVFPTGRHRTLICFARKFHLSNILNGPGQKIKKCFHTCEAF